MLSNLFTTTLSAAAISAVANVALANGQSDAFSVQQYDNGNSNIYLIETSNYVILIDGGFWVKDGPNIEAMINETGKPLAAILITHGHWDHYYALSIIPGAADAPIIATARTRFQIETMHDSFERRIRPLFGDLLPTEWVYPNTIVDGGYVYSIDGVDIKLIDYGPGSSISDSVWLIEDVDAGTHAFIGDLVFREVHSFFQDGRSYDWITSLRLLKERLPEDAIVYPGHGKIGGTDLIDWQIEYIDVVHEATNEANAATDKPKERAAELSRLMSEAYPDLRNPFLIGWSADILTKEIALEEARRRLVDDILDESAD